MKSITTFPGRAPMSPLSATQEAKAHLPHLLSAARLPRRHRQRCPPRRWPAAVAPPSSLPFSSSTFLPLLYSLPFSLPFFSTPEVILVVSPHLVPAACLPTFGTSAAILAGGGVVVLASAGGARGTAGSDPSRSRSATFLQSESGEAKPPVVAATRWSLYGAWATSVALRWHRQSGSAA